MLYVWDVSHQVGWSNSKIASILYFHSFLEFATNICIIRKGMQYCKKDLAIFRYEGWVTFKIILLKTFKLLVEHIH